MAAIAAAAIERVAIIGLGLMGSSLALAIRKFHPSVEVLGFDSDPEVVQQATKLGVASSVDDPSALDPGEVQLLFVATPVASIPTVIKTALRKAKKPLIVSDLGSTKGSIHDQLKGQLGDGIVYIGGHPMAGSELEGLEGADPFLFENAVYILTVTEGTDPEVVSTLHSFVTGLGALVTELSADVHDRIVAATSHLPYLSAVALVNVLRENFEGDKTALMLAAGGFYDTTRIASSPPGMWKDICMSNRAHILQMMRSMVREMETLEDCVTSADGDRLSSQFTRARRLRATLPPYRRGLLPTTHELVVKAQDRPGFIGEVASLLGQGGVNIRDIQVLHVREGEGGTILLSFDTEGALRSALEILDESSFVARPRRD